MVTPLALFFSFRIALAVLSLLWLHISFRLLVLLVENVMGNLIVVVCCYLVAKSYLFCDPMDCGPPGSSVHGILQAKDWSGLPFFSPGNLPSLEIESTSAALAGGFFTPEPPGKPYMIGIALNLYIALSSMAILAVLILLTQEHGIFFHSLRHLQFPLSVYIFSQNISPLPPWSGLFPSILLYF